MPQVNPDASDNRFRMHFLDGVRGLAALVVTFGHIATLSSFKDGSLIPSLDVRFYRFIRLWIMPHYAVGVFIVLSGFCLMLPVGQTESRRLKGNITRFFKRRSLRILPPYYAALIAVVFTMFASHRLLARHGAPEGDLSFGNITSHVLLVHNWWEKRSQSLDGPMWSVAMECQIYVIFALVLLPSWRRWGIKAALGTAFLLGYGFLLLRRFHLPDFSWTCPWYIFVFAIGMYGAASLQARNHVVEKLSPSDVYRCVLIGFPAVFVAMAYVAGGYFLDQMYWPMVDPLIGIWAIVLFKALAERCGSFEHVVKRTLESRVPMRLGAMSYSLYLVHYPVLQKISDILDRHGSSPYKKFAVLLAFGLPACLLLSYGFHLLFERPFMPGRPRTEKAAEYAALISPAP